ncbi:MAG: type II toxin-antitoxin system HicA family toxin [Candidatus Sumerlaeia bacterium]|nr:type II toxin-antitoxin system HicA family toxin [Candidatus Sumerlaeia bacterium]
MPQISSRELVGFLKSQGFIEERQTGSHLTMRNSAKKISVTIPLHGGIDLGRGLTARILRDAGFSVEEYLRLR